MPEETHRHLYEIEARVEGKDALEQLLGAIKKVEQAVVAMGEKLDAAMQRIAEPINGLTVAVDKLTASVGVLDTRLGQAAGLDLLGQKAKQAQVDLADLDRTLEQYRMGATRGYKLPGGLGGMFQSRQQMVERYMLGQFGGGGLTETVPAPPPTAAPGTTALTYRGVEELQKQLGLTEEQTAAVQRELAAEEELVVVLERVSAAKEQLASSTGRAVAAELRQLANWEQMVVSGGRVAEQLRQQATELMRRSGAVTAARHREEAPGVIGQVYRRAGLPVTPGLEEAPPPAVGDWEKELQQIQSLEAAIGRKIVVQKLMARGSQDVAERFEKQFTVTRSKEEILREINRTGKMTAGMEKELGLQAEKTGGQARRAGNMFRYFGRYLLRYLILWQGIQAVRGISKAWFAAHVEMADAVADFGWRVDATTENVARYRDKLRDVSMAVGMPVGEIASPLAGEATEADLLRAAEAAKVFGGSVEDWARKINAGAASLDAYAHGLRISTLATEDYAKLVDNASAIAQEFNMTDAETIGLLSALPSVLKADAEGAAELTEALAGLYEQNQLLMTLGMAPAVTVGPGGAPQRRPMREVMAEIGRQPVAQQRQLAVAIGLTGEKQQQFFLDAVAGWAEVTLAIQETVGATGDMADAIAGADVRLKTHVESMKTAFSGLLESFGTTDALKDVVDVITMSFKGWGMMIEWVGDQAEILEEKAGWLFVIGQGPGGWLRRGIGAAAELYRGEQAEQRAVGQAGAAGPGRGFAGVTPGTEAPGAAYFPPMPTLRMGEGMGIGQLAAEMERVIDEVFTRPYTTASGEVIQVTKEQIDALRKNTVILDETGEAIGLLNVYAPALAVAQENLKAEMEQQRFNLERLQDISPQQFDTAMRTILPTWEARLAAIPGFEEEKELQTFFVGEQDVLRQQLATQTGMAYTLQDILDTEKDQLEGMWNIPTGVTMRVPLQSLDLMRWMKSTGGGVATDMMPTGPGNALETAANAQDSAALAMQTSAGAQTAAAASMSDLAQRVGAEIYGGVPVEPGVAKEAALEGDVPTGGGLRQQIHRQPKAIPGAGAAVSPSPWASRVLQAQFAINLVSKLFLDKKVVTEVVQTELSRQLVNAGRARSGGGASLRP